MNFSKIHGAGHTRRLAFPGVFILTLLLSACASSGPSISTVDENLTEASSAVSEAEEVGAQEYAPLAFSDAKDKIREAQNAKAEGNHAKAVRMAEQAVVDAEYAEAKTLAAKTEQAAQQLRESIRTLRSETAPDPDN